MGQIRSLLMIALVAGLLSCTRQPVTNSRLHLSVAPSKASQKLLSQSGAHSLNDSPSLLVVNITGTGISSPILYSWSDGCDAQSCGAFPTDISLSVPRGSNRLIQVLVVYNDGQRFNYGDLVHDVAAVTENVTVNLTTSGTNVEQAHVMGRFLDGSVGGGPSGMLQGNFAPPNGSPLMLVTQTPIFAGWFNLIAFTSSSLTYTFNGAAIFPNLNLSSVALNPPATLTNVVRIHAPAYSHSGQATADNAQTFVLGFFGATTGQKACYHDTDSTITGATVQMGATLAYSGTTAATASISSNTVLRINGGVGFDASSTGSVCLEATNLFANHLVFNEQALSNGHDLVAGFKGPWQLNSNLLTVDVSTGSSPFTLTWNFLPGVTTGEAGIRGVTAFSRSLSLTGDYNADNGVACSRIASLQFSPTGLEITTQTGVNSYSLATSIDPSLNKIVLCPFSVINGSRVYHDAGAEVTAAKAAPVAPLRFNLTSAGVDSPTSPYVLNDHTQATLSCKSYSVSLLDAGTTTQSFATPTTVNIAFSQSNLSMVTSCAGGSIVNPAILNFSAGATTAPLYLNSTTTNDDLNMVTLMTSYNGATISSIFPVQLAPVTQGTPSAIAAHFFGAARTTIAGSCYPVLLAAQTSTGDPASFLSAQAMTLNSLTGSYYSTPNCVPLFTFNAVWPANETSLALFVLIPPGTTSQALSAIVGGVSTGTSPLGFSLTP